MNTNNTKSRPLHVTGSTDSVVGVARAVIAGFFKDYPQHETTDLHEQDAMLATLAAEAGFEDVSRWLGQSVCQSDGSMVFNVKPDNKGEE